MPYISVDMKAIEDAPDVGRLAGVPDTQIIGCLVRLWYHCWKAKTEIVSRDRLVACFDIPWDRLRPALEAGGFITEVDGGAYRVRGADRYTRIRAAYSKGGKITASRRSATAEPEPSPRAEPELSQNQALTPITDYRLPITESVEDLPFASQTALLDVPAGPPKKPKPRTVHRELSDNLVAVYERIRGHRYLFQDAKDGAALSALAKEDHADVLARWERGLRADGWLSVSSIAQLRTKWNDLTARASRSGTVRAEDVDPRAFEGGGTDAI